MRWLAITTILLLTVVCYGDESYLETLPDPETIIRSVSGADETETGARQIGALWAIRDLLKKGRTDGEAISPEGQRQLAAISEMERKLLANHKARLAGDQDEGKRFFNMQSRFSRDAEFKLTVISRLVPDKLHVMSAVYAADAAYKKSSAASFNEALATSQRDAFLNEYGETIGVLIFALIYLPFLFLVIRSLRKPIQKYRGDLTLVGDGTFDRSFGITSVSVLEIGDEEIRNVHFDAYIASHLQPGEVAELYIGEIFLRKWIYALRTTEGKLRKMGKGRLRHSLAVKVFLGLGILVVSGLFMMSIGNPARAEDATVYVSLVLALTALFLFGRSVRAFMSFAAIK